MYTDLVTIITHREPLEDLRPQQQQIESVFFFFLASISVCKAPQKVTLANQYQNHREEKFPKSIGASNKRDPGFNHQKEIQFRSYAT